MESYGVYTSQPLDKISNYVGDVHYNRPQSKMRTPVYLKIKTETLSGENAVEEYMQSPFPESFSHGSVFPS